jgi:hypothetical protein
MSLAAYRGVKSNTEFSDVEGSTYETLRKYLEKD